MEFEVIWRIEARRQYVWKYKDFKKKSQAECFAKEVDEAAKLLGLEVYAQVRPRNPNIKTIP